MVVYDLLWKDNKNKKSRWLKLGVLFDKDGKLSIKVNLVPVDWDGWLILGNRREKQED